MQRLVRPFETWLHQYALAALWAAVLLRELLPLLLYRQAWLLPSQLLAALLLSAIAISAGLLLPRAYGLSFNGLLGIACWAAALSLLPRYLWPTPGRPPWQLGLAAAYCLAALLLRTLYLRRWGLLLRGHGWAWNPLDWAAERPLYARQLAARYLQILGWRGEE